MIDAQIQIANCVFLDSMISQVFTPSENLTARYAKIENYRSPSSGILPSSALGSVIVKSVLLNEIAGASVTTVHRELEVRANMLQVVEALVKTTQARMTL